jgi:hypothetical protein
VGREGRRGGRGLCVPAPVCVRRGGVGRAEVGDERLRGWGPPGEKKGREGGSVRPGLAELAGPVGPTGSAQFRSARFSFFVYFFYFSLLIDYAFEHSKIVGKIRIKYR